MTITERIAAAVKPILDEHARESRERIGQLERDINEARAHLEVARTTCERLTKQAPIRELPKNCDCTSPCKCLPKMPPQTQQDGPWCVIGEAGGLRVARVAILYWQVAEARVFANVGDAEAAALAAFKERASVDHIQVVTVAEWSAMPKVLK